MTDWNMTEAEKRQHTERTRLGDACKAGQARVDRAEGELAESNNMINTWRNKKQKYQTELEILSEKDEESLGYELKMRKLDLQKDSEELDLFISGNIKRQETMRHSIEMANLDLTTSRSEYNDFTAGVDGELTPSQMREMKSIPKTSKLMTEQRRTDIINRMGISFYNDEVPML